MNTPALIEVPALFAQIGSCVVVDCRFRLNDRDFGKRSYVQGHIPSALYADLENDLSGPKGEVGGRHPLPSAEAFAAFLSRLGVGPETLVVAYDDQGEMAARLWWLLRYFGHERVSVLQGGIAAWESAGYALVTGAQAPAPKAALRVLQPQADWLATREDVQRSMKLAKDGQWLVDSRAAVRYRGEHEPIDRRAGHIPGAHCYFWEQALSSPAHYKSPEQLREHFAQLDSRPIIYCGSGVTACVNVLALYLIDVQARLYAGSWSDWCADDNNPVAVGDL
ncbi:MAG: sulfurtransferase [Firmicutes bacterium]|nr:sulfurtransferase [Bacillota bacterium]